MAKNRWNESGSQFSNCDSSSVASSVHYSGKKTIRAHSGLHMLWQKGTSAQSQHTVHSSQQVISSVEFGFCTQS